MNIYKNKINYWEIEKLIPYSKNSRTHSPEQISKIAESIKTYGFTNPILVDEEAGILAGHGRLAAAKLLKLDEVPVIVLTGLNETQKRAYVIADNKLAADAGWDDAILAEELAYLMEQNALDLAGFTDAEYNDIFTDLDADFNAKPKQITLEFNDFKQDLQEVDYFADKDLLNLGTSKIIKAKELNKGSLLAKEKAALVFADATKADPLQIVKALEILNKSNTAFYIKYEAAQAVDLVKALESRGCNIAGNLIVLHEKEQTQTAFAKIHSVILYGWFAGNGAHNFYGDRKHSTTLAITGSATYDCYDYYAYLLRRNSITGDTVVNLTADNPAFIQACKSLHRFGIAIANDDSANAIANYFCKG